LLQFGFLKGCVRQDAALFSSGDRMKIRSETILTRLLGCQIFLDTIYQKGEKYTKLPLNYQMAMKYTKWQ
jgi:hypothetical protein